jgi:citrate lyase beta subunit
VQIEKTPALLRSKLFVPAVRPELFPKALASGADAVCFDLEEAVPPPRRAEARNNLSTFLLNVDSRRGPALMVRVNQASSSELPLDLDAVVNSGVCAIALPKVEDVAEIQRVDTMVGKLEEQRSLAHRVAFLITIESPRGLRLAADLAKSSKRILGLQLGFADLLEPLGMSSTDASARQQIRLMLRLAAGEAGIDCYESAYLNFNDEEGYRAQLRDARSLGFAGASCIHLKQIAVANRVFTPTPEEIEHAKNVVNVAEEADRQGSAIAQLSGKMIDRPLVLRARAILAISASK